MKELKSIAERYGKKKSGKKEDLVAIVQELQRRHALGLTLYDSQVQDHTDFKWYILQVANGFERSIERNIIELIEFRNLGHKIGRVFVPVMEGCKGVKGNSIMPSYMFINMRMDEKVHMLISQMPRVVNFVGQDRGGITASGALNGTRGFVKPVPMTDEEFEEVVAKTRVKQPEEVEAETAEAETAEADLLRIDVDDAVEVIEGPFKGMQGRVLEKTSQPINGGPPEESLKILLPIMGRDTEVIVPLRQCDKVAAEFLEEEFLEEFLEAEDA